MSRAFVLKPGDYDAYIMMKEKSTTEMKDLAKAAAAEDGLPQARDVACPTTTAAELKVSTPILASTVEPLTAPLSPAQMEENPYSVFGAMKIVPSADGKFSKAGEFSLVFFVYGAGDAGGGKPNVTLDYSFYVKQGEGEKYFNKTAPQELNGTTLSPDFNVTAGPPGAGHAVDPAREFPGGRLPAGNQGDRQGGQQDDYSERRFLRHRVGVLIARPLGGHSGRDRAGIARAREMRHTRMLGSAAAVGLCLIVPALPASAQCRPVPSRSS